MTDERLMPKWDQVRTSVSKLHEAAEGAEHILLEAFQQVSGQTVRTSADVSRNLRVVVDIGGTVPWVLYDFISKFIQQLPQAARGTIASVIRIDTGRRYECLRPTPEGRWQIAWQVDPDADAEDRDVALNWYAPFDHDDTPIVPTAIADYIGGCVALLRDGVVLPAGALMSIALESALWDALNYYGIPRQSEKITYLPAQWTLKRKHDQFLVSIVGTERSVKELDTETGQLPTELLFEPRRLQSADNAPRIGVKFEVEANLADFFVPATVENTEIVAESGLSVALQRARANNLECLEVLPAFLDMTLAPLRNNLVHPPSQGRLHAPIPVYKRSALNTLDDIRSNGRLIRSLMPWVVEIINSVYGTMQETRRDAVA